MYDTEKRMLPVGIEDFKEICAEKLGIVIEVKYSENGDLDAGCREAMEQIKKHGYTEQLRLDGMDHIIKCGIACHVKRCKVVFEKMGQLRPNTL